MQSPAIPSDVRPTKTTTDTIPTPIAPPILFRSSSETPGRNDTLTPHRPISQQLVGRFLLLVELRSLSPCGRTRLNQHALKPMLHVGIVEMCRIKSLNTRMRRRARNPLIPTVKRLERHHYID